MSDHSMANLARANHARLAHEELKRKIRNGEVTIAEALEKPGPEVAGLVLYHMLRTRDGWSPERIDRLTAGICSPLARLGSLNVGQRARLVDRLEPWRAAVELYCDREMSLREVGVELGVRESTVFDWLQRAGVERRTSGEARRLRAARAREAA